MRRFLPRLAARVIIPSIVLPLFLACGIGSTTVGVYPPPTRTLTLATATPAPPPHALAWVQTDANDARDIWASINDAAPTQITHQPPPNSTCLTPEVWGFPMLSPDLQHIVVPSAECTVDSRVYGLLYVVTVAGGAIHQVPLNTINAVQTNMRSYGWIDNATLFAMNDQFGVVSYALGAGNSVALPNLPIDVTEAVVRGSTMFYLEAYQNAIVNHRQTVHSTLHRYNLGNHTIVPGSVDLGSFALPLGSPGDFHDQGWDASPDGTHVVYQFTTPPALGEQYAIHSQSIMYANADGSAANSIVQYMTTKSLVRMRFSPNGTLVGITEAYGTPDVLSGCVNSPGLQGDPCLQFYSPDATNLLAWRWDSSTMYAAHFSAGSNGDTDAYTPGHFNGAVFMTNAYNMWSTP